MANDDTQRGPSAEEREAQRQQDKHEKLQEELDELVDEVDDEDFSLEDIDNLEIFFEKVKKYSENVEKHEDSKVKNRELLKLYVNRLEMILADIQTAYKDIQNGKTSLGNYKKLRQNQMAFVELLEVAAAIIGGRDYKKSFSERSNTNHIEKNDDKIMAKQGQLKVAEQKGYYGFLRRKKPDEIKAEIERLRLKNGELQAKQKRIANKAVKAHYKKVKPHFWQVGTRYFKKQANYAALNDYLDVNKGNAVGKWEDKSDEITDKRDANNNFNPIKYIRSLRLIIRDGLDLTNNNIHWFAISPWGIRIRHLQNKIGKFEDGKSVVNGKENADILDYFEKLDDQFGRTMRR